MDIDLRPIAITDATAAKLLDMSTNQFRKLVSQGALPPAVVMGDGVRRWLYADIEAIVTGVARKPPEQRKFRIRA